MTEPDGFERFVADVEPRLRAALVAACGPERAADAVQEALVYGWRHWDRVSAMDNPAGYLYRVARSRIRWPRPRTRLTFASPGEVGVPDVEPRLPQALADLTERQRVAVFLAEGCDWTYQEVADLMDVSVSTVRNHLRRGMGRLRTMLGVSTDV